MRHRQSIIQDWLGICNEHTYIDASALQIFDESKGYSVFFFRLSLHFSSLHHDDLTTYLCMNLTSGVNRELCGVAFDGLAANSDGRPRQFSRAQHWSTVPPFGWLTVPASLSRTLTPSDFILAYSPDSNYFTYLPLLSPASGCNVMV